MLKNSAAQNRVHCVPDGKVKANRNDSLEEESQEHCGTLGCVRLSFRHIADHGQFKHLSLIRFQQQNEPDDEATEPDHRPY
jgi:hypothetical protein